MTESCGMDEAMPDAIGEMTAMVDRPSSALAVRKAVA